MMKRCLSLLLVVGLIAVLAVPVSAAESNDSTWIELLETETVNDSGNNLYALTSTSGTFRIKTPQYMRVTQVDMLIAHPSGYAPSSVKVRYNNVYYDLTMVKVDAYTTRVYGSNIPDSLYADLVFQINKSSSISITYQILSCRVTSLTATVNDAVAQVLVNGTNYDVPLQQMFTDDSAADVYSHFQFPVIVSDWQKFDSITINGSLENMALNSVRCTLSGLGLPYEMNYAVSNSNGSSGTAYEWHELKYYSYDESYKGSTEVIGNYLHTEYVGKVLFSITVDLSAVDRNNTQAIYCYFTALANPRYGYGIQVLSVVGSVRVADTTQASLWNRFTAFMSELFGTKDSSALDDLGSSSESISDNASQIHDFEQSQQAVLDNNFAQIQTAVTFTNFAAALVFVQKYANMTFSGISGYAIVFTLPLFLGLFFYICSRIPGITRWKTPSPRSKSKGGGKS